MEVFCFERMRAVLKIRSQPEKFV